MRVVVFLAVLAGATLVEPLHSQQEPTLPPRAALPADLTGLRPAPVPAGFTYPPLIVDRDRILELLRRGRFRDLDRLFQALEDQTTRDIRREDVLVASYETFFGSAESIAGQLDEWVAASPPESEAALVARAQFFRARAWEARGESELTDADSVRTAQMHEFLWAGIENAFAAVAIDPQNLAVYSTLLGLVFPWGWSDRGEEVLDSALTRFPASYRIRYQALSGMSPRWGGSYERMQRLVSEAQQHASSNPRLRTLRGAVALDQADELRAERRYAEAIEKLEEAREFGADVDVHYLRGRVYFFAGDYVRALEDLDRAIALRPVSTSVLRYRGRVLFRIAQRLAPPERRAELLENAEIDLREAVAFSQPDSARSAWLAEASELKEKCWASPTDCIEPPAATPPPRPVPPTDPEAWWLRLALFVISLPLTLYLVFADANQLMLLPAPLIAGLSLFWNLPEWRRQRYWAPRVIHWMSALAFLTLVAINVDWVRAGGTMWVQRYVVVAVCTLVPRVGRVDRQVQADHI